MNPTISKLIRPITSLFLSSCVGSVISASITLNDSIWDFNGDNLYEARLISTGQSDGFDGTALINLTSSGYTGAINSVVVEDDVNKVATWNDVVKTGLSITNWKAVAVDGFQAFTLSFRLTNTLTTSQTMNVSLAWNLGSDSSEHIYHTSDGDLLLETSDYSVVTDDASNGAGDPALYFKWADLPSAFSHTPGSGYFGLAYNSIELAAQESRDFAVVVGIASTRELATADSQGITAVPEPSHLAIFFGMCALGCILIRRARQPGI